MVYGTTLRIPGEFFGTEKTLRTSSDLSKCTHVFLRALPNQTSLREIFYMDFTGSVKAGILNRGRGARDKT